jgi:hypothetical protein
LRIQLADTQRDFKTSLERERGKAEANLKQQCAVLERDVRAELKAAHDKAMEQLRSEYEDRLVQSSDSAGGREAGLIRERDEARTRASKVENDLKTAVEEHRTELANLKTTHSDLLAKNIASERQKAEEALAKLRADMESLRKQLEGTGEQTVTRLQDEHARALDDLRAKHERDMQVSERECVTITQSL